MNKFLDSEFVYKRLEKEYEEHGSNLVIAVDYDSTLFDYHNDGNDFSNVVSLVRNVSQKTNVIIYTSSGKERFKEIEEFCKQNGIKIWGINKSPIKFSDDRTSKLYYNLLLDDRAGLISAYNSLLRLYNTKIK